MHRPSSILLVLALLLVGCTETAAAGPNPSPASGKPRQPPPHPELGKLPAPPPATGEGMHSDFRRAFQDGLVIDRGEETLSVRVVEGGRLDVGSGVLLVGDPGWASGLSELPLGIPRGHYPVQLSRVRGQDKQSGETIERIAAMRLRLGGSAARRWLYLASISVDTGSAAFLTPTAAEVLASQQKTAAARYERRLQGDDAPEPEDSIDTRLQAAFSRDLLAPVLLQSHPRGPHNLFACSSGFGDGSYDVYVGLDEGGSPAEVVVDFRVLLEPILAEVLIPDMDALPPGRIPLGPLEPLGLVAWRGRPTEDWLLLDATSIWNDPRYGGPEVVVEDAQGGRLHPNASMQAGTWRVERPGTGHSRLRISVQVGVRPL